MMGRHGSASVLVPCTCGELVQGLTGGNTFLVSCPIDRYSRVDVSLGNRASTGRRAATRLAEAHARARPYRGRDRHPEGKEGLDLPVPASENPRARAPRAGVDAWMPGTYSDHQKAGTAVEATLRQLGLAESPFRLEVSCPLPPAKGFGTSTADVVGAIVATATAAGASLSEAEVARLAVSVEPSDGTMFDGLAVFDHRRGTWHEPLGPVPPMLVAVLEFDGNVDTVEFNNRIGATRPHRLERDHMEALDVLRTGLRLGALDLVGQAATLSARANQELLPKAELDELIAMAQAFLGLGVCAAHSGTALGVLFRLEQRREAEGLLASASGLFDQMVDGWVSRVVDGGARILAEADNVVAGTSAQRTMR